MRTIAFSRYDYRIRSRACLHRRAPAAAPPSPPLSSSLPHAASALSSSLCALSGAMRAPVDAPNVAEPRAAAAGETGAGNCQTVGKRAGSGRRYMNRRWSNDISFDFA